MQSLIVSLHDVSSPFFPTSSFWDPQKCFLCRVVSHSIVSMGLRWGHKRGIHQKQLIVWFSNHVWPRSESYRSRWTALDIEYAMTIGGIHVGTWAPSRRSRVRVNPHPASKKGSKRSGNVGIVIISGATRLRCCAEDLPICALQRPVGSCDWAIPPATIHRRFPLPTLLIL